jgi:hypothetical protein
MCASEFGLGIGLIVTAGRLGRGLPATVVRTGVSLLFLIAVGALIELRERRPDAGCGCFGDLSVTPVGARTITRSTVLAVAAIVTLGAPPLQMPASGLAATLWVVTLVAEVLLLAVLSPELGEAMARLGYSEPCEVRRISVDRTLAALTGSAPWRRYAGLVTEAAPSDIWREGCWRYLLYPGESGDRRVDLVFAVSLRSRRPQVQVAVLDAMTDEILTGAPQSSPVPERPASLPVPGPGRLRQLPDLDVSRPMAGLGARASLDERALGPHPTGLEPQHRPGTRTRLETGPRIGVQARHRSSAPF